MLTSTPLIDYGFFNSYGDDRLYEAADFSDYLSGILLNGCFPDDSALGNAAASSNLGFKVVPNPAPILSLPPSVLVSVGKVYCNGLWGKNKNPTFTVDLGTSRVAGTFNHLLYFCFDTNDTTLGRKVTIEYVAGTPTVEPVMPANADGKFYLPLALISNAYMARTPKANPILADITDQRTSAGVAATSVGPSQLLDLSVTTPKIDNLAVTTPKIDNRAVTRLKIAENAVGIEELEPGFYQASMSASYHAGDPWYFSPTANVWSAFLNNGTFLNAWVAPADGYLFMSGAMTAMQYQNASITHTFVVGIGVNGVGVQLATTVLEMVYGPAISPTSANGKSQQFCVPFTGVYAVTKGTAYTIYGLFKNNANAQRYNYANLHGTILLLPR